MRNATRITVSLFGAIMGVAGIEHGIGEILQGNHAPDGLMISSWPGAEAFRIMAGEPAMTIVPNLLVTGILALLSSLTFLVWVTMFIERKHGGLVMILLSISMLLFGGGIVPPIIAVFIGVAATGINTPLTWWRTHVSEGLRQPLGQVWPWSCAAGLIAWLMLFPGLVLGYFFGVNDPNLVLILVPLALGLLLLTILTGYAYDTLRQPGSPRVLPLTA